MANIMPKKTPAQRAYEAAGSITELAGLLKLGRVWVWRWSQPKEKQGTGGAIPARHQKKILSFAKKRGWNLTARDISG